MKENHIFKGEIRKEIRRAFAVAMVALSVIAGAEEDTPASYKEAEAGQAWEQYNLALCYENGDGVSKDIAEARTWYQKAAEQVDEDAKEALKRL